MSTPSFTITDKTYLSYFLDEDEEVFILETLQVNDLSELSREVEMALIHAYGVGFVDGQLLGKI